MQIKPKLSIIICTHNRIEQLEESLSYYKELKKLEECEILVVANACTDGTTKRITTLQKEISQLKVIEEKTTGLSIARNTGYKAAKADFVFYIDDDAYPESNLIEEIFKHKNNNVKCITGKTIYWKTTAPEWIKSNHVDCPIFREYFGELPPQGYINGCACGFSKELLVSLGGFSNFYGMKGTKIGYFEEIELQKRIIGMGVKIFFDPSIRIKHKSHFNHLSEFLISAYYRGYFYAAYNKPAIYKTLLFIIYQSIQGIPAYLKMMSKGKIKAATLDYLSPIVNKIGQLQIYKSN